MRYAFAILALSFSAPAFAEDLNSAPANGSTPANFYVAPEHGLRVREEPSGQSRVLATLWRGARVFVREPSTNGFVRIDGYGVAGYAFVDANFLQSEAPTLAPPVIVAATQ